MQIVRCGTVSAQDAGVFCTVESQNGPPLLIAAHQPTGTQTVEADIHRQADAVIALDPSLYHHFVVGGTASVIFQAKAVCVFRAGGNQLVAVSCHGDLVFAVFIGNFENIHLRIGSPGLDIVLHREKGIATETVQQGALCAGDGPGHDPHRFGIVLRHQFDGQI